jgi:3-oxoacyl-[acyl-carrier protein] reductase
MSQTTTPRPLAGKTAIVTGSSRGIGASIATELASRGADVVITYTTSSSTSLVQSIENQIHQLAHSPRTLAVCVDLRQATAADQILEAVKLWKGEEVKIDILVNNAGVELAKKLGNITPGDFARVYDLNVRAPLLLTQALLPYIPPHSRIINISSVGSRAAFAGLGVYCSSKAALEGLTRCWAAELGGNGTTVNAVNPGPVESEMLNNIPKEIVER